VVNDDRGDDKKVTTDAISSDVPNLFIGTFFEIMSSTLVLFFASFFSQIESLNNIFPGATALILIPKLARGFEIFFTYEFKADFATEYGIGASVVSIPAIEEMQTIDPDVFFNEDSDEFIRFIDE